MRTTLSKVLHNVPDSCLLSFVPLVISQPEVNTMQMQMAVSHLGQTAKSWLRLVPGHTRG